MLNIIVQAEYSKLFGKKAPSLKKVIPSIVSYGSLITHSMISYSDRKEYINAWCKKKLTMCKKGKKEIERVRINKRPSNLILWTELLKYNIKEIEINKFKIDNYLKEIVESLSVINEKEYVGKDESFYLLNNLLYTYQDNALNQFYRSIEIFVNNRSMHRYSEEFENANNILLKEFIFICHSLNARYSQCRNWASSQNWICNAKEFSESTGYKVDKIEKVMELISFTQDECRKYSQSEDYKNHNFNFFANKPFYKLNNNSYIPVDGKLAQNLVFNNLFYRVKKSVKDKKGYMRDFGFAFEQYVVNLTKYACENSKSYEYISIPEFKYGNPEKHSSDAYILHRGKDNESEVVLVFEVKSARILDKVKRLKGRRDAVDQSIKKISKLPLEQQIKVTSNIISSNSHKELTKDKVYYFISISMEDFPLLIGDFDCKINSDELGSLKFGGLYSFNIEEIELFIKLISNNLEWPCAYLLEEYRVKYSDLSFKTFLSRLEKITGFRNEKFKKILQSQKVISDYLMGSNIEHIGIGGGCEATPSHTTRHS